VISYSWHSPAKHLLLLLLLLVGCWQDLADMERRAQAAEWRHQELTEKLPEATAPLLRQITALQDASSTQVSRGGPVTPTSCHTLLFPRP